MMIATTGAYFQYRISFFLNRWWKRRWAKSGDTVFAKALRSN
jgi:hypothetical protein